MKPCNLYDNYNLEHCSDNSRYTHDILAILGFKILSLHFYGYKYWNLSTTPRMAPERNKTKIIYCIESFRSSSRTHNYPSHPCCSNSQKNFQTSKVTAGERRYPVISRTLGIRSSIMNSYRKLSSRASTGCSS